MEKFLARGEYLQFSLGSQNVNKNIRMSKIKPNNSILISLCNASNYVMLRIIKRKNKKQKK